MATTKPRRTQVEALDDLTAQIKLANQIAVIGLGASALDHNGKTYANPLTQARADRRNELRADVRAGLGIEEVQP